ncbi:MAG: hypothetical protein KGJ80_06515 [Chloroflexota bacterium]|nr:hypothetical protein [Chloroflexota bacterium]
MNQDPKIPGSRLFTVRVWLEDLGDGKTEWRGKAQCVACGEARYFRDWEKLIEYLRGWLPPPESQGLQKE